MNETAEQAVAQSRANEGDSLPLVCVTLDARNHGKRLLDAARNASAEENQSHALDMTSIVFGTAQDVSLLLDFLPSALFPKGEHFFSRWGIAGSSMGAHTAFHAATRDIRLEYVAAINGSPSLSALYALRNAPLSASLATILRHTDANRLPIELWQERQVLIILASEDTLVPFAESGLEAFVEQLKTVAQVEMFTQAVGHQYTDEMRRTLLDWLARVVCKA